MLNNGSVISANTGRSVTLHDGVTSLAAPVDGDSGGGITGWKEHGVAPRDAAVIITATGSVTLSSAVLYGYDTTDGWRNIGTLNDGDDISLTSAVGWERPLFDVGKFERLAVSGTFTGTITVKVVPAESRG